MGLDNLKLPVCVSMQSKIVNLISGAWLAQARRL